MMRATIAVFFLLLAGCSIFLPSGPSDERSQGAYLVRMPMMEAVAALDPSYLPSPTTVVARGERVFERRAVDTRVTVRLQPVGESATRALVDVRAKTRAPALRAPSPFDADVVDADVVPLPGWSDCPDDTLAFGSALFEGPPEPEPLGPGDVEPVLIGGLQGLAARLTYPSGARRANHHGTVYVTFIVERDGSIGCAAILRGAWDLLNTEALRVVRESRFEPGQQRGRPVKVRYTLPIRYTLR